MRPNIGYGAKHQILVTLQTPLIAWIIGSRPLDIWASNLGGKVACLLDTSDHSTIIVAWGIMAFWTASWPFGRPNLDRVASHWVRQFLDIH